MTTLETKIFDFIESQYEAKFLGKVKVTIQNGEYCLLLTLSNYMIPMPLCIQTLDEDVFYKYVCKEIQQRNFLVVKYFKLIKNDTNDDKNIVYK